VVSNERLKKALGPLLPTSINIVSGRTPSFLHRVRRTLGLHELLEHGEGRGFPRREPPGWTRPGHGRLEPVMPCGPKEELPRLLDASQCSTSSTSCVTTYVAWGPFGEVAMIMSSLRRRVQRRLSASFGGAATVGTC